VEFEVTEVPAATYAVLRETVDMADVPGKIGSFIEQVGTWARSSGAVAGPPLTITSMAGEGRLNLAVGWTVDGAASPPAPIELAVYPATRAAVHVHVGAYDTLPEVYPRLAAAIAEAGYTPGAEQREVYETDPANTEPEQTVTRVIWHLA
jgi:effector-binding domain-containing protein